MLKFKMLLPQAMMTIGQFFIIPAIWFLATAEHTMVGVISSLLACFVFTCLGVAVSAHRYFTHRSFRISYTKEKLLSLLVVLSTWLSPFEWAAAHWHHHKHSDTELDTHSSKYLGWKNWFFIFHKSYAATPSTVSARLIKKEWHRFLFSNKYTIIFSYAFIVYLLGGINYLFYLWVIPTSHAFLAQMITVNNHVNGEPKDSVWQNIVTLGEGYHAHHHEYPKNYEKGFIIKPIVKVIQDA